MWFLTTFLLLCAVWFGNGENICDSSVRDVCQLPKQDQKLMFPKTAKTLERLCLNYIPFAECLVNYQEKCPSPEMPTMELTSSVLKAARTFCNNDSVWFKGVVHYGNCFEIFQSRLPRDFTENCRNKIEMGTKLAYLNDPNNHPELNRCYNTIEVASCLAEKLSKDCGKASKELALHLIREIGPWNVVCIDYQKEAFKLMKDLNFTFDPETSEEEFAALLQSEIRSEMD
ncbi:uncharacterized protein [Parasteatoda tepidariorum]|uniref:uncharacterized protein n=1 Tax=Parasteatoda tepidariorum TaxID=114398 RepID=UPI00077F9FB1|nr:uncharacterized protein LOC107454639 [Parasteatoda tepidariorum]